MRQYTPVRFADVSFGEGFWRERLETVLTRTIPSQYDQLERNGILESLKIPTPTPPLHIPISNHGMSTQVFWDSDVGKWIEAASYALSHCRDAVIEAQIEGITDRLQQAQLPDGYLNCWYIGREIDKRWSNLRDRHELYCAGHMIEGGIVTIVADAEVAQAGEDDCPLYQALPFDRKGVRLTAIPYYLWNNRGANRMLVWLPEA